MLKIVSYVTVILPIIALLINRIYRNYYSFEMLKPETSNGAVAQPSSIGIVPQLPPVTSLSKRTFSVVNHPTKNPLGSASCPVTDILNKIRNATASGLKTAVFFGRPDSQSLPKEAG